MSDSSSRPKLRWPIDISTQTVQGQELLVLNCPLGIAPQPLALVAGVSPIIACFDGQHSLAEMEQKFAEFGVKRDMLEELVRLVDEALFLEGQKFYAARQEARDRFLSSDVRPAALAGGSYPSVATDLSYEIERYLAKGKEANLNSPSGDMVGIVSPHIDYRRGGVCYGITYANLTEQNHDLYVLIGTSHQYSQRMFHLTAKDFASPLGLLPSDREFVNTLADRYGREESFADELLHKNEHSLELQIPFLRHLKSAPSIVPILVGSFHRMVTNGGYPEDDATYNSFAEALTSCLRERLASGQRICMVAGVDMAHIGRYFGDSGNLSPDFMKEIEKRDRVYLDALAAQDKHALFDHIAEDGDARRICGFPTMYTVLDVFDRLEVKYSATLFDYRQAVNYQNDCAVTFSGMGFYKMTAGTELISNDH